MHVWLDKDHGEELYIAWNDGVNSQDADGGYPPRSVDLGAVGEIAQVAENASIIIFGALLTRLIGLVAGMRADIGKDALQDSGGQLGELVRRLPGGREEREVASASGTELGGDIELEAGLFLLFAEG